MALEFSCEACGAKLRVGDDLTGRNVKCPHCSTTVPVRPAPEAAAGLSATDVRLAPPSGETVNPYASPALVPEVDAAGQTPAEPQKITARTRLAIAQTRPWVLFLSILGFVVGGITAVRGIGVMIGAIDTRNSRGAEMLVGGPWLLLCAVLYLALSRYLFRYARGIRGFDRRGEVGDLEHALMAQGSFWKLLGVALAVILVLGAMMTGTVIVFSVREAMTG